MPRIMCDSFVKFWVNQLEEKEEGTFDSTCLILLTQKLEFVSYWLSTFVGVLVIMDGVSYF